MSELDTKITLAGAASKKVSRRTFVKGGAIAGGALVLAAAYSSPSVKSLGARPAYAAANYFKDGTQGCTPGFWKNHEEDYPAGYASTDLYGTHFTSAPAPVNALTMDQALGANGNSCADGISEALVRHSAAALLNAASGLDYAYSVVQIKQMTNAAWDSGDCASVEPLKDEFDEENNRHNNDICGDEEVVNQNAGKKK